MNPGMTNTNNRNTISGNPYVFVTYELEVQFGYVAVIDPVNDRIIKRIQVGANPGPMCMDPEETKLFVVNTGEDSVTIIDAYNFKVLNTIHFGIPGTKSYPNSIFAAPKGNRVYIAHSGDSSVTIIDALTNEVIKQVEMVPKGFGIPYAFASNKKSSYVYVARTYGDVEKDRVVAIGIDNDVAYPYGEEVELIFEATSNPLTVHPEGHTQVAFGRSGMLTYFDGNTIGFSTATSLLENTVSGVYLDNKVLFCTMREERNYLKVVKNLAIDKDGIITYDSFTDFPSYRGQDLIRLSRTQLYIAVTIQPTDFQTGGVHIINSKEGYTHLVELPSVGDLAISMDTKAYVGEPNAVRPVDLASATALPAIHIGGVNATVKNIISGYSNQS